MRIETFSTDHLDENRDLERKLVEKDVVMPADIAAYAEEVAAQLEKLRKDPEKEAFVLDALSDDRMKAYVKFEQLDDLKDEEITDAMDRIRKALIEALKGKIDDKLYFVVKGLQLKAKGTKPGEAPNIISEVMAGGGVTGVHKRQPAFENFKRNVDDAMEIFEELPPHENIAKLVGHDPARDESLWEKKHITPLSQYIRSEHESAEKKFQTGLTVVKDCMQGAIFLSENGLVLQDIHPSNLGLEKVDESEKGVLFDFNGLVKEGDRPGQNSRMGRNRYFPPVHPEEGYRPSEMTYQFGKCLEDLATFYEQSAEEKPAENGIREVKRLAEGMTSSDPQKRPTLGEAEARLEAIIAWTRL